MNTTHDVVVVTHQPARDAANGQDGLAALHHAARELDGIWVSAHDGVSSSAGRRIHPSEVATQPVALDPGIGRSHTAQSAAAIWPVYHDVVSPPVFRPERQRGYRDANIRVAEAAAAVAAPAATVWIYGHDLQLVPALLRAMRPDLRIGFFLPIPFPPLELFQRLPNRAEVLRGLLGADVIGVQTPGDVDNLLRTARHLLGRLADGDQIVIRDRLVHVTAIPTSVDFAALSRHAATADTVAQVRQLRIQLGSPRLLFLGIDQLDHTAGIEQKLTAIEQLLAEGRLRPGHAVVVQIVLPAPHPAFGPQDLRHRVERLVARINGDHGKVGHAAVHYLHRALSSEDRVALLAAADVLLATPLRDGMNVTAQQYLATRVDESGGLVLSEFSGAAAGLRAAHLVNPYDLDALKDTILAAAAEPARRAGHRIRNLRRHLHDHDSHAWAARLLSTLDFAHPKGRHAAGERISIHGRSPIPATGG